MVGARNHLLPGGGFGRVTFQEYTSEKWKTAPGLERGFWPLCVRRIEELMILMGE